MSAESRQLFQSIAISVVVQILGVVVLYWIVSSRFSSIDLELSKLTERVAKLESGKNDNSETVGGNITDLSELKEKVEDLESKMKNVTEVSIPDVRKQVDENAKDLGGKVKNITDLSIPNVEQMIKNESFQVSDVSGRLLKISKGLNANVDSIKGVFVKDSNKYFEITTPITKMQEFADKLIYKSELENYDYMVAANVNYQFPQNEKTDRGTIRGKYFVALTANNNTIVLVIMPNLLEKMGSQKTIYDDGPDRISVFVKASDEKEFGVACYIGKWDASTIAPKMNDKFNDCENCIQWYVNPSLVSYEFRDALRAEAGKYKRFKNWGVTDILHSDVTLPFCAVWSNDRRYGVTYSMRPSFPNTPPPDNANLCVVSIDSTLSYRSMY